MKNYSILILTALLFPSICFAVNCTVSDSGGDYTTIAAALSSEGNGNYTITVQAPYTSNERVTVSRSGAGVGSELIIQGKTGETITTSGFTLSGDYIKISNFTLDYNSGSSGVIIISQGADYNIVDSCIIKTTNTAVETFGILMFGSAWDYTVGPQNCTISNNTFDAITKHCVHIEGQGNLIVGNVFKNGRNDCIRAFGKDNTVRSNEVYGFSGVGGGHSDFVQTFGGTSSARYVNGIILERNYVHDCSGMQIGNLEERTDWNANNDVSNITFRNNLFINVFGQCNIYVPDVKFYNNIVYKSQNASSALMFNNASKGVSNNGIVKNNMFMECGNNTPLSDSEGWYTFASGLNGCEADYNYVCRENFAAMDAQEFTETHGVNGGNPQFANYGGNTAASWALTSGSTILINKGVAIIGGDAFANDFTDISRPQGAAWDIGAYEYQLAPNPPSGLKIVP